MLTAPHGEVHDFDFLVGRWRVHNRRLMTRLRGAHDWPEFDATHSGIGTFLGGIANVDQMDFPTEGFSGMSVRAFDLAQRRWEQAFSLDGRQWETNWAMQFSRAPDART